MKDIKYEIYLGLSQKESGSFDIEEVKKLIQDVFSKYQINFSLNLQKGGYIYQDKNYVVEDGIKMTFIGKRTPEEEKEFYDEVKRFFNQESILVIKRDVDSTFEGN